ncbi:MAG: DNA topoisomerase IV subunit A [Victivallaceae bacterium]|nr:DNA topoisomerase IV subunit A [Victivallaceae bacterium]
MADIEDNSQIEPPELDDGEIEVPVGENKPSNKLIRQMMERNYLDYAAYVIKERAIPDVDDGLKPVHRRILWSMHLMDDGKFHKVANIIGQTMQYHPHGDASISDALVVLANKEYFIDRQGNFGNIYTGDKAASPRYIEARLSHLGREVLFNDDLTNFIDTYDGRKKEPVVLPVKIPVLLMLGAEGIAVGMSTTIMPHNFNELLHAQIAELRGEDYQLYPDFQQGGMMDVSEYDHGNGKIKLRAKIDIEGRKLIIREIPALTTSEHLIASIEREVEKNRLKIASINDFTGNKIEIEIVPSRGQDPQKTMQALYAYTNCSISRTLNMLVICDNRPVVMDVPSVIKRNTEKLLEYLRLELENELQKLADEAHRKTLAQIFIENRIYKDIEECTTLEAVSKAVYDGVMKFRELLSRDVSEEDIVMLLAIQIRRISLFDIKKNEQEIAEIHQQIKEVTKQLKNLTEYAISYLQALLDKYGDRFPRRTEIVDGFDKINVRNIALKNVKVGWDRKNGYLGTNVKSDEMIQCNEFDKLLCIERSGEYKIINIPDKIYGGKLYEVRRFDPQTEFGVIYRDKKTGKIYGKRCFIEKFITDKSYRLCPEGCRLEVITVRADAIYEIFVESRKKSESAQLNLKELPVRSPRARGQLLYSQKDARP